MQLYEKHRPRTLNDVAGHQDVVASLKAVTSRPDWDRDVFWIQGDSGLGKTTLAQILANRVCSDSFDVEEIDGVNCTVDAVRELQDRFSLCSRGDSGWRAAIINEAHAMTE